MHGNVVASSFDKKCSILIIFQLFLYHFSVQFKLEFVINHNS